MSLGKFNISFFSKNDATKSLKIIAVYNVNFKAIVLRQIATKCIAPQVDASPRINIILVFRRPIAATSSRQVTVDIDSSLMMADSRRPLPSILPILLYVLEHVSMSTRYIKICLIIFTSLVEIPNVLNSQ